ncbi:CDP-diacylglycerol-serine O-phosphatidyltransferase [Tulasnella sp. JGI-2019a]|nr:CDP-diacylglycerol-serine O-phosphatidyltransferase [Tulasnella sp. JGI-2019a]
MTRNSKTNHRLSFLCQSKPTTMSTTNSSRQRTSGTKDSKVADPQKAEEEKQALELQQYNNATGHFTLVRNFRPADLVTISNGMCGSMSIFSSARYLVSQDQSYLWQALAFPLAGLMFDFLDGKVARWTQSSSMLGQELDSLADLISFGVAPALLAFCVGLRSPLDTFLLTGFICSGLARLARFNATAALKKGGPKYFEGMPIPSSLALVGVMAYWTNKGWIEGLQGVPLGTYCLSPSADGLSCTGWEVHKVSLIFFAWAAMMVSKTLKVPKL